MRTPSSVLPESKGWKRSSSKGARGQKESKTVSQTKQKNKKGPSAENPCAICGSHTHWAKECPTKNEEGTKREEDVSVNGEQATQVRKNYLAIPHDTMDRDDEHYMRPDLDSMHAQPPTKLEISRSVLAALNQLRDDDIVLDTGGSESIFANADLAVGDQYFTDDGVSIGGAVSGTESIVSFTKMQQHLGMYITLPGVQQTYSPTRRLRTEPMRVSRILKMTSSECR